MNCFTSEIKRCFPTREQSGIFEYSGMAVPLGSISTTFEPRIFKVNGRSPITLVSERSTIGNVMLTRSPCFKLYTRIYRPWLAAGRVSPETVTCISSGLHHAGTRTATTGASLILSSTFPVAGR